MNSRFTRALLLTLVACAPAPVLGQAYPSKPVRITTPYPTGISPDITTRVIADKLSKYWNQQVLVEARPGGNGFIAIGAAKKAAPDGHELLFVGNSFITINPVLFKSVPYDPEVDFLPITTVYQGPFFFWVSTQSPYRTVRDIVDAARKNPEKIAYSSPYVGSPPHIGGAMLAHMTATKMLAVHYKDGPAIYTAVANGDVAFTLSSPGSAQGMVKAGRVRALAAASVKRNPDAPDVPTVEEAGGPAGYEVTTWTGLMAPRGTPQPIVMRIAADTAKALAEPDVRERFKALGVIPSPSSPSEMAELMRSELRTNGDMIRKAGLTAE